MTTKLNTLNPTTNQTKEEKTMTNQGKKTVTKKATNQTKKEEAMTNQTKKNTTKKATTNQGKKTETKKAAVNQGKKNATEPAAEKKTRKRVMFTDATMAAIATALDGTVFEIISTDQKFIAKAGKRRVWEAYPIKGERVAFYIRDDLAENVKEVLGTEHLVYKANFQMKNHWDLPEAEFVAFIQNF